MSLRRDPGATWAAHGHAEAPAGGGDPTRAGGVLLGRGPAAVTRDGNF